MDEGLCLAHLLEVAGEPGRRRPTGIEEGGRNPSWVDPCAREKIREDGLRRWPAASAEDDGGPAEETQGARDAGSSPEASKKAASGAGRRRAS
jgi:hypothetical protein